MTLTVKELVKFARSAIECDPAILAAKDPERKAKLLQEAMRNALAYYPAALDTLKKNGYKETAHRRDVIFNELSRIMNIMAKR